MRVAVHAADPAGAAQRAVASLVTRRRLYSVPGPNALWHIDGHHKLIKWKIVTHGGIDGHTRLITFLHASDNNRKETVMVHFVKAVCDYGVPSRVRCDHGGENNDVCDAMNAHRGAERGSVIRGKSTHNQRIERLWRDVRQAAINPFIDIFSFLETDERRGGLGLLSPDDDISMWALHFVFLPRINCALGKFRAQWNHHELRTEKHKTPTQLFLMGCLAQRNTNTLVGIRDIFHPRQQQAPVNVADLPEVDYGNRVQVPAVPCPLQDDQLQELRALVDPLGDDAAKGIELFKTTLEFCRTRVQ